MPRRPIPVEMSQQGSHVTSEYRRGTSAVVIGLSAAFCAVAVMLAMLVALMLTRSHRAYEQQARSTAESLVTPAQANVASGLYRVDAIMLSVLDELHRTGPSWPPANELVNAMLRSRNVLLPDIEGLRIADAQGNVQWGIELPSAATVQIADRDYFVLAKALSGRQPHCRRAIAVTGLRQLGVGARATHHRESHDCATLRHAGRGLLHGP